jgi:hypothetical protein
MKNKNVVYWIVTGLFAAVYFASGVGDVLHVPPVRETLARLGYPEYLASILGPWKIAAVITLLAPKLRRPKEWAYAGIFFDLSGGAISQALTASSPISQIIIPLVLLALVVTSYQLRPHARRLAIADDREPAAA